MKTATADRRMNLVSLTWPILIETILFMLLGFIDIFVLSRYDDIAASAVSASNQVISICNLVFTIVSGATAILISQSLGAGQRERASRVAALSLTFNLVMGLAVSAALALFSKPILSFIGAKDLVLAYGSQYLQIVGGFIFTQAILNSITSILRSHGYTKTSMYVTAIMNILNAVLDSAFVLGWFGLPKMGAVGVAIATTLARVVGVVILLYILFHSVEQTTVFATLRPFPKKDFSMMMKVGLPSAFESINYNISQLVVTSIVFRFLSNTDFITKTYVSNIVIFFYIFSTSIGQAGQIMIGYQVGEKNFAGADRTCMHSLKVALAIAMPISVMAIFFRRQLVMIFTHDAAVIAAGAALFFIDIFVELGRTFNIVVIDGLKGAGDNLFPVVGAIFSMWLISTLGAYILAVPMGMGLQGIWIAFAADECLRAAVMTLRWQSGKWKEKALVM